MLKGVTILKQRFTKLQHHIEDNYEILKEMCPITPVIHESLKILFDLDADEDDYKSWFRSQRSFIYDIEKALKQIKSNY